MMTNDLTRDTTMLSASPRIRLEDFKPNPQYACTGVEEQNVYRFILVAVVTLRSGKDDVWRSLVQVRVYSEN